MLRFISLVGVLFSIASAIGALQSKLPASFQDYTYLSDYNMRKTSTRVIMHLTPSKTTRAYVSTIRAAGSQLAKSSGDLMPAQFRFAMKRMKKETTYELKIYEDKSFDPRTCLPSASANLVTTLDIGTTDKKGTLLNTKVDAKRTNPAYATNPALPQYINLNFIGAEGDANNELILNDFIVV